MSRRLGLLAGLLTGGALLPSGAALAQAPPAPAGDQEQTAAPGQEQAAEDGTAISDQAQDPDGEFGEGDPAGGTGDEPGQEGEGFVPSEGSNLDGEPEGDPLGDGESDGTAGTPTTPTTTPPPVTTPAPPPASAAPPAPAAPPARAHAPKPPAKPRAKRRGPSRSAVRRPPASQPAPAPLPAVAPSPPPAARDIADRAPPSAPAAPGKHANHTVRSGETLWSIAKDALGPDAGAAEIQRMVSRLWRLNAAAIGTGDPNTIYPGQRLRLR